MNILKQEKVPKLHPCKGWKYNENQERKICVKYYLVEFSILK